MTHLLEELAKRSVSSNNYINVTNSEDLSIVTNTSNVQYRYYIIALCCLNTITIVLNSFLNSKINQRRKKLKKSLLGKLLIRSINTPIWLQVSLWVLISVATNIIPYFEDLYVNHLSIERVRTDLWKRAGGVGYAMTPFILLLSLKPSPLPKVLYTRLLPLHKWCGRIYVTLIVFHSIVFLQRWARSGAFWNTFLKINPITGFISFILWLIVLIVSIKPVRRRFYKTFYFIHIVATWTTVPLVGLHARPNCKFVNIINLLLLGYMVASKIYCSITNNHLEFLKVEKHINSQLVILSLPKNYYHQELKFNPGTHLRINYRLLSPLAWMLPSHPYTVASLDIDEEIKLIIKETRFKILPLRRYNFSLPYNGFESRFFDQDYDLNNHNITIVCGGSGVAFGLPIYRYFVQRSRDVDGSGIYVHFVWLIKNINDLFVLVHFGILDVDSKGKYFKKSNEYENLDIYITTEEDSFEPVQDFDTTFMVDKPQSMTKFRQLFNGELNTYVEMDDYNGDEDSLLDVDIDDHLQSGMPNFIHQKGRPNLSKIMDEDFAQTGSSFDQSNCLLACGPSRLLKECHKLAKLHNAEFITESYSF